MKKCVFFDRDGIVNKAPESRYVERWEEFHILPGFVAALRVVKELGYEAIVVTNQQGVAKGVFSLKSVQEIHRNMEDVLGREHGLSLLEVCCCPHMKGECECRKPSPGMLLNAAKKHKIDLKSSWMVGNHERDIEAGRRAGCRTILVVQGQPVTAADLHVESVDAIAELLEEVLVENRRE